jgi:teichuronic acid exporter
MSSLAHKSITGFAWHMLERMAGQAAQFVISVVLARLLTPADFGLIGMLSVFTMLAQVCSQVGFGSALIQKKNATDADYSTVFYINVLMGTVMAVAFHVVAPYIASFYGEPELTGITRVSTLTLLIGPLGSVQRIILRKQLNLKKIMWITVSATVLSGTLGISMATYGFGVWALVWQGLFHAVLTAVLLWITTKWKPRLTFCVESCTALFGYGSKVWLARMIDMFFLQLNTLVIGKFYSAESLGYYTRAKRLRDLSAQNLSESFATILFPLFSSVNDDLERFRRGFRQVFQAINFFSLPILVGMAWTAPSLILVVYGDQWTAAVPYFQLMCILILPTPSHQLYNNVLLSLGHSGLLLKLTFLKRILSVVALAITFRFGIVAILIGNIVSHGIASLMMALLIRPYTLLSFRRQIADIVPTLFSLVVMSIGVYGCSHVATAGVRLLILQIVVGGVLYLGMSWFFNRRYLQMGIEYLRDALLGRVSTVS